MEINLKKLGIVEATAPDSYATCADFIMIWGASSSNRAILLRLCAAAIAVCTEKKRHLPSYDVMTGNPVGYGHTIVDRLNSYGLLSHEILELGIPLLNLMLEKVTFTQEVSEKVNFTAPNEVD